MFALSPAKTRFSDDLLLRYHLQKQGFQTTFCDANNAVIFTPARHQTLSVGKAHATAGCFANTRCIGLPVDSRLRGNDGM